MGISKLPIDNALNAAKRTWHSVRYHNVEKKAQEALEVLIKDFNEIAPADSNYQTTKAVLSKIDKFLTEEEIEIESKKITSLISKLMLQYETDSLRPLTMDM